MCIRDRLQQGRPASTPSTRVVPTPVVAAPTAQRGSLLDRIRLRQGYTQPELNAGFVDVVEGKKSQDNRRANLGARQRSRRLQSQTERKIKDAEKECKKLYDK